MHLLMPNSKGGPFNCGKPPRAGPDHHLFPTPHTPIFIFSDNTQAQQPPEPPTDLRGAPASPTPPRGSWLTESWPSQHHRVRRRRRGTGTLRGGFSYRNRGSRRCRDQYLARPCEKRGETPAAFSISISAVAGVRGGGGPMMWTESICRNPSENVAIHHQHAKPRANASQHARNRPKRP